MAVALLSFCASTVLQLALHPPDDVVKLAAFICVAIVSGIVGGVLVVVILAKGKTPRDKLIKRLRDERDRAMGPVDTLDSDDPPEEE